ncbi:MAG: hypothetical protein AAGI07_01620, partial [Bacteroidota bacterium]
MKKKEGQLSKSRMLVFKILAISLPFLLIFLLEVSLRLLQVGDNYSVFIEDKTGKFKYLNPAVSKKYFLNQANATTGFTEAFQKTKQKNTFRIFVMGASTAVGFPYFHNGSFHRMLAYRLHRIFPDVHFEIINTGLTAINSYTLVDFAEAIAREAPDAVLIYAGHNEYYGALGVGSTSNLGNHPVMVSTMLKIRDLRLVQLILKIVWSTSSDQNETDVSETLMERMVNEQKIFLNSEAYQNGINQFELNLNKVLKHLHQQHIPVLISTIASNLKDQSPLLADYQPTLAEQAKKHVAKAKSNLEVGDTANAILSYKEALNIDSSHAENHFDLATLYYKKRAFAKARKHFMLAKENDLLRFRAPEKINGIINNLANTWENVHLVDVKKEFENEAENNIPGKDLFLEHLHPNQKGYYLIAETFVIALKNQNLIKKTWPSVSDSNLFWEQVPFTKVDSLYGLYKTWMLKEQWPFNEPMPAEEQREKTFEEKVAGGLSVGTIEWGDAMNAMFEHYSKKKDLKEAMKITESLILEFPYDLRLYDRVGKLCEKTNEPERAFTYYKRAFALEANEKWSQKV